LKKGNPKEIWNKAVIKLQENWKEKEEIYSSYLICLKDEQYLCGYKKEN
jgi:hypothetical protein